MKTAFFWFRRDLRLEDNIALMQAINSGFSVQPIFIFDSNILDELEVHDPRIGFIHSSLKIIDDQLRELNSSLMIIKGDPLTIWKELILKENVAALYFNHDYEPYAISRDLQITDLMHSANIEVHSSKDQVIFEKDEIVKNDGNPYTVFTPYKNKWLNKFTTYKSGQDQNLKFDSFQKSDLKFPKLEELEFQKSDIVVKPFSLDTLNDYHASRDIPHLDSGSYLGPHLRFGTVSVRKIVEITSKISSTFLSELIWREFFMQILYHFPDVVNNNFRAKYNAIQWRNDINDFEKWCSGYTGYPMVDAGMRQLNKTGYMHNRVRMITAGFLCKHLLIDWRWGETYFAKKLLDYELSSNNGNWQWSAGTGCDAAPYFRIFNPTEQLKKFDRELIYVKRWVPEYGTSDYPTPMIEHKMARERALQTYSTGLRNNA